MTLAIEVEAGADALRSKTKEIARRHRASWIELGQYLFTINKDKLYKSWGYLAFQTYCQKELNLKEATASKLLKSYSFLEKEEPRMARPEFSEAEEPKAIPNYESVNLLRLAKENKNIAPQDFADLRHDVLTATKEPKEIRAQVKKLLSESEVKDPAEVRRTRRNAAIKRLITTLATVRRELASEKFLPDFLLKQMEALSQKLEDQLE